MNLFRKEESQALIAAAQPTALELAEQAVEAADKRLSDLWRKFEELRQHHRLGIDLNGNVILPVTWGDAACDEIRRKVSEYQPTRSQAHWEFQQALKAWASLKPANP